MVPLSGTGKRQTAMKGLKTMGKENWINGPVQGKGARGDPSRRSGQVDFSGSTPDLDPNEGPLRSRIDQ